MKLCLDEKKVRDLLFEKKVSVTGFAREMEVSPAEVYQKFKGTSGVSIKQLNKLCIYFKRGEEDILTEQSLIDLDDYRNDMEYLDTLNAQY